MKTKNLEKIIYALNLFMSTFCMELKQTFKFDRSRMCTLLASNSLSVTDTTPPRKQVAANNMDGNCVFAIASTVHVLTIKCS